jgi:hypothetical protein
MLYTLCCNKKKLHNIFAIILLELNYDFKTMIKKTLKHKKYFFCRFHEIKSKRP